MDSKETIFLHSQVSIFSWDHSCQLINELRRVLLDLQIVSIESPEKIISDLEELLRETSEMKKYSLQYSFSKDQPENGFTSFIKIVSLYFDKLIQFTRDIKINLKKNLNSLQEMVSLVPFMKTLVTAIKLVREQSTVDASKKLYLEVQIYLLMSRLTVSTMKPFFSQQCLAFWLPESLQMIAKKELKDSLETLYPGIYHDEMDQDSLEQLAADKVINGYIGDYVKHLRPAKKNKPIPDGLKCVPFTLHERQKKFIIDSETGQLVRSDNNSSKLSRPIEFIIFTRAERSTDTIVYQIHGGSWMMGSPNSYAMIIDRWIQATGACVISIDYSLAPDQVYPTALQEVVDGYLWLNGLLDDSNKSSPLDFKPKDIVIAGDSAGGNLSLSLAIILSEINRLDGQINLPKAMTLLYPCASPGLPYDTASMMLFDPVYPCSLPLKYISSYIYKDLFNENESYLLDKNDPWFKKEEELKSLYIKINGDRTSDEIFHILSYKSFHLLSSIHLFIQVGEYDQLVDCCISIAKQWKGSVTLDIIPNMIHTFAKLTHLSKECAEADALATARLKQAVFLEKIS